MGTSRAADYRGQSLEEQPKKLRQSHVFSGKSVRRGKTVPARRADFSRKARAENKAGRKAIYRKRLKLELWGRAKACLELHQFGEQDFQLLALFLGELAPAAIEGEDAALAARLGRRWRA